MNDILEREDIAQEITNILNSFEEQCRCTTYKKGIYIYGSPGCGKTYFVTELLKQLNYDIIKYDAGDVRNKALIDTITCDNISNRNVLEMMHGRTKKIAIVMDEIDGMNNGDKGGITQLIKLIRQKKTKKQKLENVTLNPIICIGNYYVDKKIKELMKVCHVFELKSITPAQMHRLLHNKLPILRTLNIQVNTFIHYIQGDFRKLTFIQQLVTKKPDIFQCQDLLDHILQLKSYNDDAKHITHVLINRPIPMYEHSHFMNETDRTIIALLFHENIIDALFEGQVRKQNAVSDIKKEDTNISVPQFYSNILRNICFADYIDRITFQNQIWVFNEMSSLIKTFYNNYLYHQTFPEHQGQYQPDEVRFTKVLTKYSTEYNNQLFIYNLCQELDMDKKDVIALFQELRLLYGSVFYNNTELMNEVESLFEETNIRRLDIKRMYRYLDKNVKPEVLLEDDMDDD